MPSRQPLPAPVAVRRFGLQQRRRRRMARERRRRARRRLPLRQRGRRHDARESVRRGGEGRRLRLRRPRRALGLVDAAAARSARTARHGRPAHRRDGLRGARLFAHTGAGGRRVFPARPRARAAACRTGPRARVLRTGEPRQRLRHARTRGARGVVAGRRLRVPARRVLRVPLAAGRHAAAVSPSRRPARRRGARRRDRRAREP